MVEQFTIRGSIPDEDVQLIGSISGTENLTGVFDHGYKVFPGPYYITPTKEVQTIKTKDYLMTGDVVIEKMPSTVNYREEENDAGGFTAIITGE